MIPDNTICVGLVLAQQILAVEVGIVTTFVPPGAVVRDRTVLGPCVVISVLGTEGTSCVVSERVPSSACKKSLSQGSIDKFSDNVRGEVYRV